MSDLERRALAAEKTVAVLKKKVFELYNGDRGSLDRALESAKRREEENRRKRELAELRAGELARYSATLEDEVARRTEAIKTILDNVTFGFLVTDRALVVQPESTRSCVGLFGARDIEGRRLPELLGLTPRAAAHLELAADQVFDDLLPEEVSLGQLPQKFVLADRRVLRAEGSVIRASDQTVRGMLFSISDITALEEATAESTTNRTLVTILKQKEAFQSLLIETKLQVRGARGAAKQGDVAYVRRVIHTVKGNAASYGLSEVVDLAHAIEEKDGCSEADLDEILGCFRGFLRRHMAVLMIDFDRVSEHDYAVSPAQVESLRGIQAELSGPAAERLAAWTSQVLSKPAQHMLGPIEDFTGKLGERLGKDVALEVRGADTIVDVETMRPVLMSLPHLIRNSIDHGIEAPTDRIQKGERGHIKVRIEDRGDGWGVLVEDDGRGIDFALLHRKAIERGVTTSEAIAKMPDRGIELIFVDGLSTALVTTNVSGRGVGMSAVRSAVEEAHGTMKVTTEEGKGTMVGLFIPKPREATRVPR